MTQPLFAFPLLVQIFLLFVPYHPLAFTTPHKTKRASPIFEKFSVEGGEFVCPWANKEQGDPIFQKGVSLLSYFVI